MRVIRHPKLADDIRGIALHYAEISERVLSSFWRELDLILASIERNPRSHHFDISGLRRANFKKFPYHCFMKPMMTPFICLFSGMTGGIPASGFTARSGKQPAQHPSTLR